MTCYLNVLCEVGILLVIYYIARLVVVYVC